ncbi:siderophore-interacting protein [Thalassotalea euphylliae]|nr:siderophore-interacting protein [Thalassotalea euphylliae]
MAANLYMTQVSSVQDVSPHMRRVVLTGESLADFPVDKESAHIKAIFPDPSSQDKLPTLSTSPDQRKWMRSYTIRQFNQSRRELTIDFAVNDHQGLAADWALNAQPNDFLGVAGPGDIKHTDFGAHQHLFFGDITALPAIAATLEQLPLSSQGQAWLQVPDSEDIQEIIAPRGIKIHWLVTSNKLTERFLSGLQSVGCELTDTAIFIAAEASIVRQLKAYLSDHCQYTPEKLYASAYWNSKR